MNHFIWKVFHCKIDVKPQRKCGATMANSTCGMKAPSVGLEIPGQSFGGIPESLVVYGVVTICAVILYLVVRRLKCAESCTLGDYAPPYLNLLKGCCNSVSFFTLSLFAVQVKRTSG